MLQPIAGLYKFLRHKAYEPGVDGLAIDARRHTTIYRSTPASVFGPDVTMVHPYDLPAHRKHIEARANSRRDS
jgi:hypothetical protein